MTIIELKEQIMKKSLSNFYIFTGEEIGIMNIYLEQISKVLDMPITRADNMLSIIDLLSTPSIFGPPKNLYVVRNDTDFYKDEKSYTDIQNRLGKNTLILLYTKLDSRLKFTKTFANNMVLFEPLAHTVLCSYIKKASGLSDENCEELSNKVSGSYDLAMLEVDKLIHSSIKDRNEAFKKFISEGVIGDLEQTDVFKFTSAVCSKKKAESIALAHSLISNGASSINILGTLYNSMKSVLLIQVCSNKDICGTTGLDNRQVYFNKQYVGKYPSAHLVYSVKFLAEVIDKVKTGRIDDTNATLFALSHIL